MMFLKNKTLLVLMLIMPLILGSIAYAQNAEEDLIPEIEINIERLETVEDEEIFSENPEEAFEERETLLSLILSRPENLQSSGASPEEIASIFFTDWEYAALDDAIRNRGALNNAPTEAEILRDIDKEDLNDGGDGEAEERIKPPPEERFINLQGIAFTSKNDWTIWLNGERVTAQALPKEIITLEVFDNFIEVKWYDDFTRQIYALRIKPNQRFNLDTRIFLPG